MKKFFKKNRDKLFNILQDGEMVILFSGEAPVKRGDEKYPFSPDRNFYYITGIEREKCAFIMSKINEERFERLYIEEDNGEQAKWVGATMTSAQAADISGIESIKTISEIYNDIEAGKRHYSKIFLDWERKDLFGEESLDGFKSKYKNITFQNIHSLIAEMRVIKEPEEIELIEKAIEITKQGIEAMMKNAKAGMMEYEIEAYYDFVLKSNGVREKAFQTIAASGKNATVLHYTANNSKTEKSDLILIDAGAQKDWYNGDLSRTFPVGGKFGEREKLIYNIVLEGQKLVMEKIKPDVTIPMLNEALKEYYFHELKKIGLIKYKEEVTKYYYHNVGHFLGAETHDVGDRTQNLKPNMVLTVEPGLYIEEWGIGVRIEDDVLVTENGYRNLSSAMIKTVEEIESFMAKGE